MRRRPRCGECRHVLDRVTSGAPAGLTTRMTDPPRSQRRSRLRRDAARWSGSLSTVRVWRNQGGNARIASRPLGQASAIAWNGPGGAACRQPAAQYETSSRRRPWSIDACRFGRAYRRDVVGWLAFGHLQAETTCRRRGVGRLRHDFRRYRKPSSCPFSTPGRQRSVRHDFMGGCENARGAAGRQLNRIRRVRSSGAKLRTRVPYDSGSQRAREACFRSPAIVGVATQRLDVYPNAGLRYSPAPALRCTRCARHAPSARPTSTATISRSCRRSIALRLRFPLSASRLRARAAVTLQIESPGETSPVLLTG